MKTFSSVCAAATLAITASTSPSAHAQDTVRAWADSNASGTFDRARNLESILGREVRTRAEGDSGRIIDVLTDRNGNLQAAVVEMGGFLGIGTRKIAVEWQSFSFDMRDQQPLVLLNLDREQLRLAPEYTAREPAVVRKIKE